MATRKTKKETFKWTPQMQFSKRIARIILVYWIIFVTATFVFLVLFEAIDAIMALTGWVTAVMITMVGAYTGNSMYEKHLDKGIAKNFLAYNHKSGSKDDEDEKSEIESIEETEEQEETNNG